jgi:hypothetical protein
MSVPVWASPPPLPLCGGPPGWCQDELLGHADGDPGCDGGQLCGGGGGGELGHGDGEQAHFVGGEVGGGGGG